MWTVIGWATGVVFGGAITYVVGSRVVHRSKLSITLNPTLVLFPSDLDVADALTFRIGAKTVENLCALELLIQCRGRKDITIEGVTPPRPANATPLPRIDFTDFRIIGVRTLNNDASRFYIPIARHSRDHGLHLNLHRLRAGATARFQIVGQLESGRRTFSSDQCQIFPGAIPDVDLVTAGTIHRPWLTA